MGETILVNAAAVLAGAASTVEAYQIAVPPEVDFRIVCDKAYSVRFYVANADFSDVTNAAELSGTDDAHAATTGIVYHIDAGSYDKVAAVVTNEDSTDPAVVTIAVGYDLVAEAATALFTVAEARAFHASELSDAAEYQDAEIIFTEKEVRAWFEDRFGVSFFPVLHTDELHDGDGTDTLDLDWPLVNSVSAVSLRSGTTWTDLTADQLDQIQYSKTGRLTWEGGCFPRAKNAVKVTYIAGHASVPSRIRDAALMITVDELCVNGVPYQAESYDAGGVAYTFGRGDGYNDNWFKFPQVMAAYRAYHMTTPGLG